MRCPQCGKEMEETAEDHDGDGGMQIVYSCTDCDVFINPDDPEDPYWD